MRVSRWLAGSRQRERRWENLLGLAIVVALMAYALYAEHVLGLEACPLCIFQRMAFIGLGAVFLVAALHNPAGLAARAYGVVLIAVAAVGAGIAGRHVYIQNLPAEQVPACGPGLDYIMDAFPLLEALELVFTGSGECAVVNWSFLGLSMPGWTFIWFVLLAILGVAANWKRLAPT
ncbi:MAG TPA: disulfide bond formation protein B [Gammaproteobacteria bacterium]|jgi:disulfide bond formation protein DsbB